MQGLGLDEFSGRLNESFEVELEHERVPFVLIEAQPLPSAAATHAPFSLLFRHAATAALPQQIYTMRHAALGQFGLFLVPVTRDKDGVVYQAVFN